MCSEGNVRTEMCRYSFGFYVRLHQVNGTKLQLCSWYLEALMFLRAFTVGHIGIECEMCIRC